MFIGVIIVTKIFDFIQTEITESNKNENLNIGKNISFYGEISIESNFPIYTHKITNKNGEIIFLKSSNINLNKYIGELEIYGEIIDHKGNSPIIEVSSIKFPEQSLIIKNNIYFFVKDMLYLDFTNQPDLSAKKDDKEIQIFYKDEKISNIERFLCNRVLRQKDCNYLIEDYGATQKENFDSYRGYTYYKHGTGLRTVFDGTMFGYIFKDIEVDNMLSLSNIIRIVDKNFVLENKIETIKETCAKNGEIIEKFNTSSIQYDDDNKIHIIIESQKSKNSCKITFDIRNERKIIQTQIINK
ncbi:MAG: hypothetical protein PHR61_03320 [Candidatus Absconditabacteria bacterium]|nr:hypothetical protein [Candidatus Absconditabacteria bacterium]